ncbi:glycosyltransferase [Calothrix sp. PCC 7507]|uniref:glycosyltransferase n=1 Tax=Calothrix sp. PCC 7507 TaxID=99598 RepID=UPI00029F3044|nr:glycosyltransferase [Calothrix sp. PCC 7507]AFY36226.1 glycosyl transferase group 1 [Calothrix sp. PCC 7507]
MHILQVHNTYKIRGGEEETCAAEVKLLQDMGHKVAIYGDHNDRIATINPASLALNTIWSSKNYTKVKQILQRQPYDVVHIHNFFPLISPSVYYAAKDAGVRVVQTLHNYRFLCPNGLFFRDGQVCEDCLGKFVPLSGVQHGCYREDKAATAGVAAMLILHRLLNTWKNQVDCYISMTEFGRQKFIEGGFPAEKIVVKPHFVAPDPGVGSGSGGYALYVGRLSVEKGLDTLLAAWEQLGGKIPLKIIGDGQLSDRVKEAVAKMPGVEWLGRKPINEVYEMIGEAKVLILPSKWYETFGRVAIEAFAKGTPVIAANIGAIAELVDHQRTGLHFIPGDAQDLAQKMEWIISHPIQLAQMRQEARSEFENKYTAKKNYQQLIQIYAQVKN